jgi:hypothetical protein
VGVALIHWGFTAAMGLAGFRFLALAPPGKLALYAAVFATLGAYALWVAARARRAGITHWSRPSQSKA